MVFALSALEIDICMRGWPFSRGFPGDFRGSFNEGVSDSRRAKRGLDEGVGHLLMFEESGLSLLLFSECGARFSVRLDSGISRLLIRRKAR